MFFNPALISQFCGESMSEKICHVQKHSSVNLIYNMIMRSVSTALCACEGKILDDCKKQLKGLPLKNSAKGQSILAYARSIGCSAGFGMELQQRSSSPLSFSVYGSNMTKMFAVFAKNMQRNEHHFFHSFKS